MRSYLALLLLAAAFLAAAARVPASFALADTSTSTLQAQIDDTSSKISGLQDEIAQLQKELDQTSTQKQTLQTAIKSLTLSRQKLTAQISLTQAQIREKDSQIASLSGSIATTTQLIGSDTGIVEAMVRDLNEQDKNPLQLFLLQGGTLSDLFDQLITLSNTRDALEQHITQLGSLKSDLESTKTDTQNERAQLASLKSQLNGQQLALTATINQQNQLLAQTKNQESSYQSLIAQKKAQEAEFENELENFQNQLKGVVDLSTLPPTGHGVLTWPLDKIRITQYFGNTDFATKNPQIYNGHGHSGVDFAASIGTPVKSAGDGVVMGTGNTDLTCPNASYGKWVLIKHNNGLATLYAHLSVINATEGQTVATGDVIGYSGETGYATGPHLHFGVFAADVVQISSFPSASCKGKIYTMPVAPLSGYLNPLSYL